MHFDCISEYEGKHFCSFIMVIALAAYEIEVIRDADLRYSIHSNCNLSISSRKGWIELLIAIYLNGTEISYRVVYHIWNISTIPSDSQ